jgi:hypothetical protein
VRVSLTQTIGHSQNGGRERRARVVGWARVRKLKDEVPKTSVFSLRFSRTSRAKHDSIHTLVKDGWCWWYKKYAPGDTGLEGLEREAKKGLWADPQPGPAWEWRRSRVCNSSSLEFCSIISA